MKCGKEQIHLHALGALPAGEARALEEHLSACPDCRRILGSLRPVVGLFSAWDRDVLRPPASLWARLSERIAGSAVAAGAPSKAPPEWIEPEWKEVAPGLSCKLLSEDERNHMVSMLVRLAPGVRYPPHTHGGTEELHLLDGELWIGDRQLHPGDYNRSEAGTSDSLVWSETGCTCVLITSTRDTLR